MPRTDRPRTDPPLTDPPPADRLAAARAGEPPLVLLFYGHEGAGPGPWLLSQWYPSPFTVDGDRYPHAEAWMMAAKARAFGDTAALAELLAGPTPERAKAIGRAVQGFDSAVWAAQAYDFVVRGNLAKFGQDPQLRDYLVSTAPALLVEASPVDLVWGSGLGEDDPGARSPAAWRGRNLLGFALTEVRERLADGPVPRLA